MVKWCLRKTRRVDGAASEAEPSADAASEAE